MFRFTLRLALLALLALGLATPAPAGDAAVPTSVPLEKAAIAVRILAEVTSDDGSLTDDLRMQFWGLIPEQLRQKLADETYRKTLATRMFAGLAAQYASALLSLERGGMVQTEDYERAMRQASDSANELVAALVPQYPLEADFAEYGSKFILAAANGTPISTSLGTTVLTREIILQLQAKGDAASERLLKLLTPPSE